MFELIDHFTHVCDTGNASDSLDKSASESFFAGLLAWMNAKWVKFRSDGNKATTKSKSRAVSVAPAAAQTSSDPSGASFYQKNKTT